MKKSLILAVAAAVIVAVGCNQQKQATNDRTLDAEKDNIQKSAREAKSEVDKQAKSQKDMLNAEAKVAEASIDAEKARAKAEATPNAQAAVDAAAQNIRDAAGAAGARAQSEVGAARNVTAPPATTPPPAPPASATTDSDQKLSDQVRTAIFGGTAESTTDAAKNIQVSAIGSTVTLKGSVKTEEEKTRIETAAKAVSGVTKVDNQLEVKAE
jgi:osmotically-inducible protein OsmY